MTAPPDTFDVVVVGAGPAGLAAVDTLAAAGARVLVVDEQSRPGGQIYRQPPAEFTVDGATAAAAGRRLVSGATRHPGVTWWHDTTAWGVFGTAATFETDSPGLRLRLATYGPAGARTVQARALLLTAGAYDLPVPFPGWTLPGVMTAGGVQVFGKSQRLLPGRRFVLAGAHPLLLLVAAQLAAAGAAVAEVAFAGRRPSLAAMLRTVPALPGHGAKLAEAAQSLATLRRAGVPVRFGTVVRRAHGDAALESVTLAEVDDAWRVRPGTDRTVDCDVLALGYGFVPSTELARQAGCQVRYDAPAGGWVVTHDDWLRTSVPGIAVAGEVTGVAGAEQAAAEGTVAASGLLGDLGLVPPSGLRRLAGPAHRDLLRRRRFSAAVSRTFPVRPEALGALVTDDTVLCRCEEVTAGEVRSALRAHPHLRTADAVKLVTRTGMGLCQGRSCQPGVCQLIAAETGQPVADVGAFTARPPVKPLPLAALAATAPEDPATATK